MMDNIDKYFDDPLNAAWISYMLDSSSSCLVPGISLLKPAGGYSGDRDERSNFNSSLIGSLNPTLCSDLLILKLKPMKLGMPWSSDEWFVANNILALLQNMTLVKWSLKPNSLNLLYNLIIQFQKKLGHVMINKL